MHVSNWLMTGAIGLRILAGNLRVLWRLIVFLVAAVSLPLQHRPSLDLECSPSGHLLSSPLGEITEADSGFRFGAGGEVGLTGVSGKQRVFEVRWA